MAAENGVKYLEEMSRESFHQYIIKGIGRKYIFSHLVTAGAEDLSGQEKEILREFFQRISPKINPQTDQDFNEIATVITSRSVQLR